MLVESFFYQLSSKRAFLHSELLDLLVQDFEYEPVLHPQFSASKTQLFGQQFDSKHFEFQNLNNLKSNELRQARQCVDQSATVQRP